jgi:hypothetical protein
MIKVGCFMLGTAVWLAMPGALLAQAAPAPHPAAVAPAPLAPLPVAAQKPLPGSIDFISPVGEPVHSQDSLSGAEHWFARIDADHDGRVTLAEYMADAERFFARLDTDHDGEIGPEEIDRYETQIAPEIRVVSTGANWQPHGDDDSGPEEEPYPDRIGAGRYSWIDLPEPILAMDTNFDRAISRKEFLAAARKRFVMLDADTNGILTRDELPKISAPRDGRRNSRSATRGRHGEGDEPGMHHSGMGGMGGGGMGAGGMGGMGGGGMSPGGMGPPN